MDYGNWLSTCISYLVIWHFVCMGMDIDMDMVLGMGIYGIHRLMHSANPQTRVSQWHPLDERDPFGRHVVDSHSIGDGGPAGFQDPLEGLQGAHSRIWRPGLAADSLCIWLWTGLIMWRTSAPSLWFFSCRFWLSFGPALAFGRRAEGRSGGVSLYGCSTAPLCGWRCFLRWVWLCFA